MILKIGKLYKVSTDDKFYYKPNNIEDHKGYQQLGHTTWPRAFVNEDKRLYDEFVLFLGTEIIFGDELNKFLWANKFVYIRAFSLIEHEYRFQEIECDNL